MRVYTQEQKERKHQYSKLWRISLRKDIINHYGGKCICCGCSEFEFLAIDHTNGNGNKERAAKGSETIWRNIIKNNYPKDYRILCHNCNQAMGAYGYCPHKSKRN